MNKTKIDFKSVLAGIGIGFVVLMLVVIVSVSANQPNNNLAALITGENIDTTTPNIAKDYVDGFDPEGSPGYCGAPDDDVYTKIHFTPSVNDPNHGIEMYDGRLYVVYNRTDIDGVNYHEIRIYDPKSGKQTGRLPITSIGDPYDLAFDSSGKLYILGLGNNNGEKTISRYSSDPDNRILEKKWVVEPKKSSRLSQMTIANDIIYLLTNYGAELVTTYSTEGVKLSDLIKNTTALEHLGIAVDGTGNIYLSNVSDNKIRKYNSKGNLIKVWGGTGVGDGQFNYPTDLYIDGNDSPYLYVMDTDNHRVQKFTLDGKFVGSIRVESTTHNNDVGNPDKISIDKNGNLFVSDYFYVSKFSMNCGNIVIVKDTPNRDPQYFTFHRSGGFPNKKDFYLDDNTDPTYPNFVDFELGLDTYVVSEEPDIGFQTSVNCISALNNASITPPNKVEIKLTTQLEKIVCTFTNRKKGDTPTGDTPVIDDSR